MNDLNLVQQVTLNDMNLAPRFKDNLPKEATFKWDGLVFGSWNKNVISVLVKKGFVELFPTRSGNTCVNVIGV